jgi:hypothetical protein
LAEEGAVPAAKVAEHLEERCDPDRMSEMGDLAAVRAQTVQGAGFSGSARSPISDILSGSHLSSKC